MSNMLPHQRYVDCHTHLDLIYEKLNKSLDDSFDEWRSDWPTGFDGCLCTFSGSFENTLKFLDLNHPLIYGALAMSPHNASQYTDDFEQELLKNLKHPRIRAMGEIGLDYHYTLSPVEVQKSVFERQAKLGVELQLPLTIHMREAEDDTFEILKKAVPKDHPFHIHCFTDGWNFAEKVLKEFPHAMFGFTGVLTFKNSTDIQQVCSKIPLDHILSETDGPYMAPIPHRRHPSMPGYIPLIVQKIAELHNADLDETYESLRRNATLTYKI